MKKVLVFSFLTAAFFVTGVAEANFTIQPRLLDESVQARDTVTREITLKNTSERKLIVYATVNEITLGPDGEIKEFISPVMTDRTQTVTSWIEVTRGRIELEALEEKKIPVTFRIHPYAEPGEYYAFLGFVSTSKRPDAEAVADAGQANGVAINIAVESVAVESLVVSHVATTRLIIDPSNEEVQVTLKNDGDVAATPSGEVIFYNTRGVEVGAVDLNTQNETIESGEAKMLTVPLVVPERLGRYRASVNVINNNVSILESAQFYVIPLPILIALITFLAFISALLTYIIRRSIEPEESHEDGHEVQLYDNTGTKTSESADHDITLSK